MRNLLKMDGINGGIKMKKILMALCVLLLTGIAHMACAAKVGVWIDAPEKFVNDVKIQEITDKRFNKLFKSPQHEVVASKEINDYALQHKQEYYQLRQEDNGLYVINVDKAADLGKAFACDYVIMLFVSGRAYEVDKRETSKYTGHDFIGAAVAAEAWVNDVKTNEIIYTQTFAGEGEDRVSTAFNLNFGKHPKREKALQNAYRNALHNLKVKLLTQAK